MAIQLSYSYTMNIGSLNGARCTFSPLLKRRKGATTIKLSAGFKSPTILTLISAGDSPLSHTSIAVFSFLFNPSFPIPETPFFPLYHPQTIQTLW